MKIAVLSTTKLPKFLGENHPDEESLFAEDKLLIEALVRQGATAERIPWRGKDRDWSSYDLALLRSTWDYIDDLPAFLAVLGTIEASGCRLVNPLETVRWNATKRYLAELQSLGLPVVPSLFLDAGQDPAPLLGALGSAEQGYVAKPFIGVGAFGTRRFADRETFLIELANDHAGQPLLIQPFLPSVTGEGEWSFVFGARRFLYAALKIPRAGDYRVQVMYGAETHERMPAPQDLELARRCYELLPKAAPFARMDFARLPSGQLALMEAELIEPQLFLHDVPRAAGLLAEAVLEIGS